MAGRSDKLAVAMEYCSRKAQADFDALLGKLDATHPVECKEVLLAAVPAIVGRWGDVAALAAAQFYQEERGDVGEGPCRPLLAPPVELGAIEAKVRYALRYLFGGEDDES